MRIIKESCDRCKKNICVFDNLKPIGLFTTYDDGNHIARQLQNYGELCKCCRKKINKTFKKFMSDKNYE